MSRKQQLLRPVAPIQRGDAWPHRLHVCLTAAVVLLVCACSSIPRGRAAVDAVELEGAREVSGSEVTERIVTAPTPKFLGFFRGVVYDYEIFNRAVLQTDLQRIERYYRSRGFYKARVRAGRIFYSEDKQHVRVLIEVEEGPPVLTRRVLVRGVRGLPPELLRQVRRAAVNPIRIGERFEEEAFVQAETDVKRLLTDNGYAYATVTRVAEVDLPRDWAVVAFDVEPGPTASFGDVSLHGLGELPEAPVRRALDIQRGDRYSTAELEAAQQALLELGVFSSVRIEPVLDAPEQRVVPLRVTVEPSRLRSVQLGGGVQADAVKTDVHLLAGWEHRNFFGGLRRFEVQFRPGLVLYPTRVPDLQAPTNLFPEGRLRAELRQPGFLEARTNGFIRTELNVYPVLLTSDVDPDWPVLGYREVRAAVGVDRTFGRLYASLLHNVQSNMPFAYKGELDPDLGSVLASYPELLTTLDLRDDRVQPHEGVFVSNDLQVAGVGGDARDVKVQPDVRGYVPLSKRLTLALRGSVGFLLPQNYGDTGEANARGVIPSGEPGSDERKAWVRDIQLTFLRGFFGGGPTSNRGYALREIGPHGVVPFYNPGLGTDQLEAQCDPTRADYERTACRLPLGGLTLWEASIELRIRLQGALSMAVFCDTADVAPGQLELRFDRPHLSCGAGARYDTPVGPIRLDVGYRLPGLQILGNDDSGETDPNEIFGLPIAIAFGIGEAF